MRLLKILLIPAGFTLAAGAAATTNAAPANLPASEVRSGAVDATPVYHRRDWRWRRYYWRQHHWRPHYRGPRCFWSHYYHRRICRW